MSCYGDLAAILSQLPSALRRARRTRGISMEHAAKWIGVSTQTVSNIEAAQPCNTHTLALVLRWLDDLERNPRKYKVPDPRDLETSHKAMINRWERAHEARRLRDHGLTVRKIADQLGVSATTIVYDLRRFEEVL